MNDRFSGMGRAAPTRAPAFIDAALLDGLSATARGSPRLRRNHSFHRGDDAPCNRLLNAIEPGSYVQPHRHVDPTKDETLVVVRGRLGAVLFDETGEVTDVAVLEAGGRRIGIDLPHGTFHSLLALEPGTVFFEAKAGPYLPLGDEERAAWAPAEESADARAYHARLERLVRGDAR